MKKLSLLLAALLFTAPAWAKVRITVVPDGKTATIKYATDGEKVRAFALDITADKGVIQAISGFIRGESTKEKPGYGIFPANFARCITVDPTTGEVAKWDVNDYTPVADPCDPGISVVWAPPALRSKWVPCTILRTIARRTLRSIRAHCSS